VHTQTSFVMASLTRISLRPPMPGAVPGLCAAGARHGNGFEHV
jgi:hypothetical protein